MPGFAPVHSIIAAQPIADFFVPSTDQKFPLGMVLDGYDPYWGYGRFVYAKAAAAQTPGSLVTIDNVFVATATAGTANKGYPIFVVKEKMSTDYYGWYQFEGMSPVQVANSVAAGVVLGLGTTGIADTVSNGKQILNMIVQKASTFTITKTVQTQNGSAIIQVPNQQGLFYGLTLSGTGIAAGTITAMDSSGRFITNSGNSTATGSVTMTGTYTGFVLASYNCPFTQGQVV